MKNVSPRFPGRFPSRRRASRRLSILAIAVLFMTTTACFVLDMFDVDKTDGECPPDRVDSVCMPLDGSVRRDGGPEDAGPDRACGYMDGTYAIQGCPASTCVIDQPEDDCILDVVCQSQIGEVRTTSYLESNGFFTVTLQGTGTCNLQLLPNGSFTGRCDGGLVGSCNLTGVPR